MASGRPAATVSVDVDPVDLHLLGYGVGDAPPDARVYEKALPRLRKHLQAAGIRATFFVVARDAARFQGPLADLVAAGHEVASHSLGHPADFARKSKDEVRKELESSREALEAALGRSVVGFRAPGWEWPPDLPAQLAEAGYRYDASLLPSPALGLARAVLFLRSARGRGLPDLGMGQWWAPREPHTLAAAEPSGSRALREFPVSVTRVLRVPVYHTLRYGIGAVRFGSVLDRLARSGHPLSYALHAVDVLGLHEDGVDPRMQRHPGMRRSLDEKLALLDETLAAVQARFDARPFAERLGREPNSATRCA